MDTVKRFRNRRRRKTPQVVYVKDISELLHIAQITFDLLEDPRWFRNYLTDSRRVTLGLETRTDPDTLYRLVRRSGTDPGNIKWEKLGPRYVYY